jgi:hypothetical protein
VCAGSEAGAGWIDGEGRYDLFVVFDRRGGGVWEEGSVGFRTVFIVVVIVVVVDVDVSGTLV